MKVSVSNWDSTYLGKGNVFELTYAGQGPGSLLPDSSTQ